MHVQKRWVCLLSPGNAPGSCLLPPLQSPLASEGALQEATVAAEQEVTMQEETPLDSPPRSEKHQHIRGCRSWVNKWSTDTLQHHLATAVVALGV